MELIKGIRVGAKGLCFYGNRAFCACLEKQANGAALQAPCGCGQDRMLLDVNLPAIIKESMRESIHRFPKTAPPVKSRPANTRSSSFSIFSRRILLSFSCSVGTYPLGGLTRRRGWIPASLFRFRRLYRFKHFFTPYLSLNPNFSAISRFVFPLLSSLQLPAIILLYVYIFFWT